MTGVFVMQFHFLEMSDSVPSILKSCCRMQCHVRHETMSSYGQNFMLRRDLVGLYILVTNQLSSLVIKISFYAKKCLFVLHSIRIYYSFDTALHQHTYIFYTLKESRRGGEEVAIGISVS